MALVTVEGVQHSKMGKESLRRLLRQLSIKKIISIDQSDLVCANSVMGVHARKLYRPGMTGIVQRDEAIKAGAEGSIRVAVHGRQLVITPDKKRIAVLAPQANAVHRRHYEPC